jgi:subtilisin family serine protease
MWKKPVIKLLSTLIVVAFVSCLFIGVSAAHTGSVDNTLDDRIASMASTERAQGEVIVGLRDGSGDVEAKEIFSRHGYRTSDWERLVDFMPAYIVRFSEKDKDIKDVLRDFLSDDDVLIAEPNYVYHLSGTGQWVPPPNDSQLEGQWGLWDAPGINAVDAWDIEQGSGDIIVAVLDTAMDITHEDLAGNTWVNDDPHDGADNDGNGYPDDTHGWNFVKNTREVWDGINESVHATHVAGIIGAETNNSEGVAGVCPNVKIMPVVVIDTTWDAYLSYTLQAFEYAVDNGADIINCSFGGGYSDAEEKAVSYADSRDCIVIAASGNFDKETWPTYSISWPAALPSVISVGANDWQGRVADFSCYVGDLDLVAPGVSILSTVPGNQYGLLPGTSMAAPHVSGVAALILSHEPSLTNDMVKYYLTSTAYKPPGLYNSTEYGHGILDAYEALKTVTNPPDISPVSEWYFPEGSTDWGYEEWICVQNPNDSPAKICLELMTPTSSTFDEVRTVPANSRTSIRVNDILTSDVSVRLLSDSTVYAERSLYWADRREGHTCHGLKHDPLNPNSTWYMAWTRTSRGW